MGRRHFEAGLSCLQINQETAALRAIRKGGTGRQRNKDVNRGILLACELGPRLAGVGLLLLPTPAKLDCWSLGAPKIPAPGLPFFYGAKLSVRVVQWEVPTTSSNSVALGRQRPQELTRRESEVVLLVGTGMSNREIAQQLGLSVGTVKLHVHHIFRKTGARRRSNLVVQMAARGSAV